MTCKDCIHYDVCGGYTLTDLDCDVFHYAIEGRPDEIPDIEERCSGFKDKSRFVDLPCKVGDTVYIIDNRDMLDIDPSVCSVVDDEIYEMGCGRTQSGELKWLFLVIESGEDFYDDDVGKTVFLTREEAENALKGKT